MELFVDQDLCISCGLCIDTCPQAFDWNQEGKAAFTGKGSPEETEKCSREALEECPVDAIQKKLS